MRKEKSGAPTRDAVTCREMRKEKVMASTDGSNLKGRKESSY
jgi:hypothetical protein